MLKLRIGLCAWAVGLTLPAGALAENSPAAESAAANEPDTPEIAEVIVTAQKRVQNLNDVGMSVAAVSGQELLARGVTDTADLGKIVAGFRFTPSNNQTPVYTLRGIGLYDSGLSASPTVSVYVDEVPLAFPVMTRAATLDLERVEVLKGPQGTLFGQNSTGGAVNYIAAKPMDKFEAGADLGYGRFDKVETSGFVSGPLTDTLRARVALRVVEGGAWQYSLTRPDDQLGAAREIQGRLLLDWQPVDSLKVSTNLTASQDHSDTLGEQLISATPAVPALAAPGLVGSPIAPNNPRAADWTPGFANRARDEFYQAAVRAEYTLSPGISLISISNYAHQKVFRSLEQDGSAAEVVQIEPFGTISTYGQELRLTGNMPFANWIVGANYDHASVSDNFRYIVPFVSTNQPIPTLPRFEETLASTEQGINSYALFANAETHIGERLTAHAGARYTKTNRVGDSCTADPTAAQATTGQFNGLQELFAALGVKTTPVVPILPGHCLQFTAAPDISAPGPVHLELHEHNVSWRGGLDYKIPQGTLLYANVSRGYKAGVISPIAAVFAASYKPVTQERVDAYEVGLKAPLWERRLEVNVAAFYYNYFDKQIRTRIADPFIGYLEVLDNVPKSRVIGAEAELIAHPVRGLDLSVSGSYLDSKVSGRYITTNGEGRNGDFNGSRLPYTPRYSLVSDAQYAWDVGRLRAFVGGGITYNGRTQATFITSSLPAPEYQLGGYVLLDVRAGFGAPDDTWRVQFYGRNIANKFYVVNVGEDPDTRYRYAGTPATFGVMLTLRTQ
jgi:iron complex outermembrane receptor protein